MMDYTHGAAVLVDSTHNVTQLPDVKLLTLMAVDHKRHGVPIAWALVRREDADMIEVGCTAWWHGDHLLTTMGVGSVVVAVCVPNPQGSRGQGRRDLDPKLAAHRRRLERNLGSPPGAYTGRRGRLRCSCSFPP